MIIILYFYYYTINKDENFYMKYLIEFSCLPEKIRILEFYGFIPLEPMFIGSNLTISFYHSASNI